MTQQRSRLHIDTPIDDLEEIPYDRSQMGPGSLVLEIEFNREEINRLKARHPRGPLIRFIKQAALERADREARHAGSDELREAD
ncbi:MAG: hypothetical protein F4W96_12305 [Chloroflexi bacterium]|nr:hypothetical protein [Chloroflexota bacterium]